MSWLSELLPIRKSAPFVTSPARAEKPVGQVAQNDDERLVVAFSRMARGIHSEIELVKYLRRLSEQSVCSEVAKLERENANFSGFTELYDMPPSGFKTEWHSNHHSIVYGSHEYLRLRVEALNAVLDTTKAVLVVGSDDAFNGTAEKLQVEGYPTTDQFMAAFDATYAFFSRDVYAQMLHAHESGCESFVNALKGLSGTPDYESMIAVIVDEKEHVIEHFTGKDKEGKRYVKSYAGSDAYKATPEKVLEVLEPPDEKELALIDAFVVAYGGKLLRNKYFVGTRGEKPDHNMWTGDGMSLLLDSSFGIKRDWRPHLTRGDLGMNPQYPDVSLRSIEDAARALHVVNRLNAVFKKHGLI